MARLDDREREILRLRFHEDLTQSEIGERDRLQPDARLAARPRRAGQAVRRRRRLSAERRAARPSHSRHGRVRVPRDRAHRDARVHRCHLRERSRASRTTRRSRSGPGGSSRSARASRPHERRDRRNVGLFTMRLAVPGAVVPMAGVTAVGVDPVHRRRGLLDRMMRGLLEEVRERGEEAISALWASEAGIYGRWGFGSATRWAEVTVRSREAQPAPAARRPAARRRADGAAARAARGLRRAAARGPGMLERDDHAWGEALMDVEQPPRGRRAAARAGVRRRLRDCTRSASTTSTGAPTTSSSCASCTPRAPEAAAVLWDHLLRLSLTRSVHWWAGAEDLELPHMLTDARAVTHARSTTASTCGSSTSRARSRSATYRAPVDVVLEVADDGLPVERGPLAARGRTRRARPASPRPRPPTSRSACWSWAPRTSAARRWRRSPPPAASRRRRPARSPRRAMRSSASARRGRSRSSSRRRRSRRWSARPGRGRPRRGDARRAARSRRRARRPRPAAAPRRAGARATARCQRVRVTPSAGRNSLSNCAARLGSSVPRIASSGISLAPRGTPAARQAGSTTASRPHVPGRRRSSVRASAARRRARVARVNACSASIWPYPVISMDP